MPALQAIGHQASASGGGAAGTAPACSRQAATPAARRVELTRQQIEQQQRRRGRAQQLGRRRPRRRRGQLEQRRAGLAQRGQQRGGQRVAVARHAELAEQRRQPLVPAPGRCASSSRRRSAAPNAAGAGRRAAGARARRCSWPSATSLALGRICCRQFATTACSAASALISRVSRTRARLDGRAERRVARQAVAALGLAAHVEPQAVAAHPAARDVDHRVRPAAHELDLEFAHRPAATRRRRSRRCRTRARRCRPPRAACARGARCRCGTAQPGVAAPLRPWRAASAAASLSPAGVPAWRSGSAPGTAPAGTLIAPISATSCSKRCIAFGPGGLERLHPAPAFLAQAAGPGPRRPAGRPACRSRSPAGAFAASRRAATAASTARRDASGTWNFSSISNIGGTAQQG